MSAEGSKLESCTKQKERLLFAGVAPLVALLGAPADRKTPEWAALTVQYTAQHHKPSQVLFTVCSPALAVILRLFCSTRIPH